MVNDLAFCAVARRSTLRSAAPASILINDRRSIMRRLAYLVSLGLIISEAIHEACAPLMNSVQLE